MSDSPQQTDTPSPNQPVFTTTCLTEYPKGTPRTSCVVVWTGTGTPSLPTASGDSLPPAPNDRPQSDSVSQAIPTGVLSTSSNIATMVPTAISTEAFPTTPVLNAQSNSKSTRGVSPGAVAGIAIATAIIGAAIAFAMALFLFKRKRRNHPILEKYDSNPELVALSKGHRTSYSHNNIGTTSATPAMAAVGSTAPRGASNPIDLANISNPSDFLTGVLPPPVDDATLASKVTALLDQITRHVDTFYRDVHASVTTSMESELARFGRPEATGGVPMVELLQNCQFPTSIIKHALTNYVISITNPEVSEDDGEETLFPREVVGVAGSHGLTPSSDLLIPTLLHRALSVHIHNTSHASDPIFSIREAAEHFALTFFPWANPGYNDAEKDEDLVQIIIKAREVSIWLFGQMYVTEWVWESTNKLRGVVTTRPGLVRKSDSAGRRVEGVQGSGQDGVMVLEPAVVGT